MFCFKFQRNRAIKEKFDFWGDQILSGGPEGGRGTQFEKIEKASYRTVVSTHTENFSIPALLCRKCSKIRRTAPTFMGF